MTPTELDPEALERMEAAANLATPGPWSQAQPLSAAVRMDHVVDFGVSPPNDPFAVVRAAQAVCHSDVSYAQNANNAAFIAAADPTTILALIAELRVTRRALRMATNHAKAYLERARERENNLPEPKYELCETVLPSGERCVRPKDHKGWSKRPCSPTIKWMEYSADTQIREAKNRVNSNKEIKRLSEARKELESE